MTETGFYYFALFFFILSLFLIRSITRSPLGKVLQGIRENESRMEAIGYKTRRFKVFAFVLGGFFMGLAGTLHALFMNFVDISNVSFSISAKVIMMEIVGGVGTLLRGHARGCADHHSFGSCGELFGIGGRLYWGPSLWGSFFLLKTGSGESSRTSRRGLLYLMGG